MKLVTANIGAVIMPLVPKLQPWQDPIEQGLLDETFGRVLKYIGAPQHVWFPLGFT